MSAILAWAMPGGEVAIDRRDTERWDKDFSIIAKRTELRTECGGLRICTLAFPSSVLTLPSSALNSYLSHTDLCFRPIGSQILG